MCDSVSLGEGLDIFISNMCPGEADAANPGTALWSQATGVQLPKKRKFLLHPFSALQSLSLIIYLACPVK